MKQSRREGDREKLYVGVIWIGDKPGKRISVWAENSTAAQEQVEAEYGNCLLYTSPSPRD